VSGPRDPRLAHLLEVAALEAAHLQDTLERLASAPLDAAWVRALDRDPILAERVDAFGARFGRLQDTLGHRLIPALLRALQEPLGSALDNLDRMERLGLLDSVDTWVEARNLRNRLVHEYVRDPAAFAAALDRARALTPMLLETHHRLHRYARDRLGPF